MDRPFATIDTSSAQTIRPGFPEYASTASTAEFSRFFHTYATLAKATRAGARYQISQPPGSPDATAKNIVVFGNPAGTGTPVVAGLPTAKVKVTPNKTGGTVQTVTVSGDDEVEQAVTRCVADDADHLGPLVEHRQQVRAGVDRVIQAPCLDREQ